MMKLKQPIDLQQVITDIETDFAHHTQSLKLSGVLISGVSSESIEFTVSGHMPDGRGFTVFVNLSVDDINYNVTPVGKYISRLVIRQLRDS